MMMMMADFDMPDELSSLLLDEAAVFVSSAEELVSVAVFLVGWRVDVIVMFSTLLSDAVSDDDGSTAEVVELSDAESVGATDGVIWAGVVSEMEGALVVREELLELLLLLLLLELLELVEVELESPFGVKARETSELELSEACCGSPLVGVA